MAYAGQSMMISTVITDFDGVTVLISPNVTTVTIDIADPTDLIIVSGITMTYNGSHVNTDGTLGAYEYKWMTPPLGEGAYQVRIIAVGPNLLSKNYTTVRLRKNKDPFNVLAAASTGYAGAYAGGY